MDGITQKYIFIKGREMKVNDFIEKQNRLKEMKTRYQLGKFMNAKTSDGYYLVDCSGLIKGIL